MPGRTKGKSKPKIQFKTEEQAERFVKTAQEAEVSESAAKASGRIVPPRPKPVKRPPKSGRSP